jgi:YVTN family beta-propeller protein
MWRATLLLFCIASATARADTVYVLNSGDASISVVDVATLSETRRIPLLREAHHMVLSPGGREIVLGDSGANELVFMDPRTGEIHRRERVSNPYHLEYSPDGRFLVIASLRRGQIDIYDAASMALLHRFHQPGDKPSHVAFSPDSRWVYVTLQGTGRVSAMDLSTGTVAWVQEVGPQPAGIIWNRGKLLIGLMGRQEFVTLDPVTREVMTVFQVGRGAHTAFPAPDGRTLYATSRVDSRIAEVDAETYEVRRVFNIPGGPDCLTFDPEGRIFTTLRWTGRMLVFDPRTGDSTHLRVGRSPHGIFYAPDRPGLGADFAYAAPGAASGSRPMVKPAVNGRATGREVVEPASPAGTAHEGNAGEPINPPAEPAAR